MTEIAITLADTIKDKFELFSVFTDSLILGHSDIQNWDAFEELLNCHLEQGEASISVQHFGLKGLQERAEMVGGLLEVDSIVNQGTTVCLRIEVKDDSGFNLR